MWKTRDKDFILLREQQVKDVANLNTHMHIHMCIHTHTRFPDGAMVKNPPACTHTHTHCKSTCQCRRYRFNTWLRKIPRRRKWQPTPVFLPEKSHGQRSLVGYRQEGRAELDTTEVTWHILTGKAEDQQPWKSSSAFSGFYSVMSYCPDKHV